MQRDRLSVLVVVTALLAMGLVGAALVTTSGAQDAGDSADRSITVDATGGAASTPDQAVVRVAATAEGDDPAAVRTTLAERAEALRANLSAANVSGDDYQTTEYRISEPRRPPEEREGPAYEGVHAFEVTLEDPDRAGAVIDAAADANARIDTVEFTLSEDRREALRADAIDDAMADARTQAGTIADSGGLQVTDVATVDASQQNYSPVRYEAAAASGDAGGTSIDTGEVTVEYQVRVTYNASLA
jgi:uncharacterized protein YggE